MKKMAKNKKNRKLKIFRKLKTMNLKRENMKKRNK